MMLNEPLWICRAEVKNRIVVPPISDFGTIAPDGLVHQSHIERYEAYAKGGAGLSTLKENSIEEITRADFLRYKTAMCMPHLL